MIAEVKSRLGFIVGTDAVKRFGSFDASQLECNWEQRLILKQVMAKDAGHLLFAKKREEDDVGEETLGALTTPGIGFLTAVAAAEC